MAGHLPSARPLPGSDRDIGLIAEQRVDAELVNEEFENGHEALGVSRKHLTPEGVGVHRKPCVAQMRCQARRPRRSVCRGVEADEQARIAR